MHRYVLADIPMRDLFIYGKLYEKEAGSKKGGYHITFKSEGDLLPVTISTITFLHGNKSLYADERGIIEARLKDGEYSDQSLRPASSCSSAHSSLTRK